MSLPPVLVVDPLAARRFMRQTLLLDRPAATLADAVAHHGYIQIDPINVCGRMHDLILRNRVAGYREGDLVRHLHGAGGKWGPEQRVAFEHHLPSTGILAAFPLDAWPHLLTAMDRRTRVNSAWSGKLTPQEKALTDRILAAVAERGPISSDEIARSALEGSATPVPRSALKRSATPVPRSALKRSATLVPRNALEGSATPRSGSLQRLSPVWGPATLVKSTMQKLFFHGRLLIAGRGNGRRRYDLPERVLPARILNLPAAPPGETGRWLAHLNLRQRRLAALKRAEIALVEDLIQPVKVGGGPILYCLNSDMEKWSEAESERPAQATLLAPLDPLIYDRKVTKQVWAYDYTWEVYMPEAKRKRGYYAMPLLVDLHLVGHVDSKADRVAGRLRTISTAAKRGHKYGPAFKELAWFLGLKA
jgi:uncharacterized protein YcaQ